MVRYKFKSNLQKFGFENAEMVNGWEAMDHKLFETHQPNKINQKLLLVNQARKIIASEGKQISS